ncbi:MAG: choice-of-anchor J domain-containing protein [Desulfobacterales bacterium]|nr:choice-of-anchor J domain-containing protein [Desulfobacterales bacterium]
MILIGMIVVLFLISSLVVAMMSQSTSTAFSLAFENSANRAYYLAESGFRYAVARINAGADVKTDLHLHTPSFSLAKSAGSFDLSIFPHYLVTTAATSAGSATLDAETPGGYDNGSTEALNFPGGGRIRIVAPDGTSDDIYPYTTATVTALPDIASGKYAATVRFAGLSSLPGLPSGTVVLPVATEGNGSDQSNVGGDDGSGGTVGLVFTAGSADAFPKYNGTFRVNGEGIIYSYEEKDDAFHTLNGIKAAMASTFTPFVVPADADIVLGKFLRIKSVGAYRNAVRTLTYHMPRASDIEEKIIFTDNFENKDNWTESGKGSHEVQDIGGDKALRVIGTGTLGTSPKASLIAFKPSAATIDLDAAYRYGDRYFLSYDAQVKIGFTDTDPDPDHGYDPAEPIPRYFAAGINFRLDENLNSYGVSYLRGSSSTTPLPDNMDDNLVPADQKAMIVLWQQTGGGTTPRWIAAKDMSVSPKVFIDDDVESGSTGWSTSGLWHETSIRSNSSSHGFYYGREASNDYDTGRRNSGNLITPAIDLCHVRNATLRFYTWHRTEASTYYDRKYVHISTDGGNSWIQLTQLIGNSIGWVPITISLDAYLGETIQIRFQFDTIDAILNNYEGWYVDDIRIQGEPDFPKVDSTLMVRIKEAASINFVSGAVEISAGDIITGSISHAIAIVAAPPIVRAGTWGSGAGARGTLLLRNVSGDFDDTTPETIAVSGTIAATVSAYDERSNFIRVYHGDPDGCGSPDGDLLDEYRSGNARSGDIHWPPDTVAQWDAAQDHFTLIQWDQVNSAVTSAGMVDSRDEPNAIIRSNESVLLSPTSGVYGKAELGLHTFGKGALNVYFDDFGVQSDMLPYGGILPAIQH